MESNIASYEIRDDYIFVVARSGQRDNLESIKGLSSISELIASSGKTRVMMDYREATFSVRNTALFNVTRVYELFDTLKAVKLATLINEDTVPLAMDWLTYCRQRGFHFRYFLDFDEAENWLLSANKI